MIAPHIGAPVAYVAGALGTLIGADLLNLHRLSSLGAFIFGLILVAAAWLAGHTRPATAVRHALAPTLRDRPAIAYVTVYAALLLLIVWGPAPATRQLGYIGGVEQFDCRLSPPAPCDRQTPREIGAARCRRSAARRP